MRPLLLLLAATAAAVAAEPDITVDAATVLRGGLRQAVGINVDWLIDADARRPAGSRPLARTLAEAGLRSLRFPGGEKSDNHLWTTRGGDDPRPIRPGDPVPSPLVPRIADAAEWPGGQPLIAADRRTAGVPLDYDAFIACCRAIGAEPVVVVAYDSAREITGRADGPTLDELVASAAAWVRYARERGHRVRWWEIGNESWFRKGHGAAAYAAHVRRSAAAMRAEDPDIRIGAHGDSEAWFRTVLTDAADSVDWLAVHDYPTWDWQRGYDDFLAGRPLCRPPPPTLAALRALPAERRRPIAITETGPIDWAKGGWDNINDLGHALVLAAMLGEQLSRPEVVLTQHWNTRYPGERAYAPATVPNPVRNPGFEDGLAGWQGDGGEVVDGGFAGKALRARGDAWIFQDVPLPAGATRTLHGRGRVSATEPWVGVGVDCLDAGGKKLHGMSVSPATTSGWQRLTGSFTAPAGTVTARVWIRVLPGGNTALIDDLELTDRVEPRVYDALAPDNTLTPAGEALALWSRHVREDLVAATGTADVAVWASRDARGLTLWLLNKPRRESPARVTVRGVDVTGAAKGWRLAGTGPEDLRPHSRAIDEVPVTDGVLSLVLPPTSLTVLSLATR